jgi:hypothetical protein
MSLTTKQNREDYTMRINKIDSSKHNIKQRALMEADVLPRHPGITLFSGSQGGGKSTLVANLLTKAHMYGKSLELAESAEPGKPRKARGYFDAIFLFIGSDDDMYHALILDGTIQPDHVVHTPSPADIQQVIDQQKRLIAKAEGDLEKTPKILVIFDDIINDRKLINSKPFLELFVKGRHLNSSSWLLCQYLNLCPKSCRLQANYLFVFKCNRAELQVLCDQFQPPDMSKAEFFDMVQDATRDNDDQKNNFLVIVKRAPIEQRFRQNLDHFIMPERQSRSYENPSVDVKAIKKHMKKNKESSSDSDGGQASLREVGAIELPVRQHGIKEHTSVLPHVSQYKDGEVSKPRVIFDRATLIRLGSRRT